MMKLKITKCTNPSGFRASGMVQILLAACALFIASPAAAVHPYERWAQEFGIDINASYDGVRTLEMKDGSFQSSEYKAPGKMRTEVNMGGMSSAVILREDLGKSWILMPSMGFYKEDSLEGGLFQTSNGMEFSEIEKLGQEEIDGWSCTKFKLKFEDKEGKGAGFMWITDSGVPFKMDMIYSSRGEKGQRITMQFTELNLREQDPQVFELPPDLKPMSFSGMAGMGQVLGQGGQTAAPTSTTAEPAQESVITKDMPTEQQACLQEAIKAAEEKREAQKKKRAFGRLMGAVAGAVGRYGGSSDLARATSEVYSANATAEQISSAAKDLGITEDDIERCRNPAGMS